MGGLLQSTDFPRELVEMALAHVVGNETEAAYRRGSALEDDPEKHALGLRPDGWKPAFPRDKRGTRLRGDHAQTKSWRSVARSCGNGCDS